MDFGQYVKQLRARSGLPQEEVAKEIGVVASYVGHMEKGRNIPSPQVIRALAKLFEVPSAELMSAAGYIEPTDAAETAKELAQYKSLLSKLHGLLREAPSTQYITGAGGIPSGASPAIRVPVLGRVPAGPLMEAIEEAEVQGEALVPHNVC